MRRAAAVALGALLGLVALACACGHHAPAPAKSLQRNAPGEQVDVVAALPAGYVTIVDFWSDTCGACKVVEAKIAPAVAAQARVVVRKIDVGDGVTPVARAYEVNALPHYKLYDRYRRLRYVLVGNDCLRAPELARELAAEP